MSRVEARARGRGPTSLVGVIAHGGLVVAVLVLGTVLLGGALPWRLTTVDTGSMSPSIPAGSLALERAEPTSALRVGQVVTYLPPGHAEELTHRVTWLGWDSSHQAMFRTRGDANRGEDPWQAIAVAPQIWTVAAHLPVVGRPMAAARELAAQPVVLALLVLVALLALWVRPRRSAPRRRLAEQSAERDDRPSTGPARGLGRVLTRRTSALALVAALTVTGSVALQAWDADSAQAAFSARTSRAHAIKTVVLYSPTAVTATAGCLLGAPRVTLTWTSPADGRTAIAIQRRSGASGTWTTLPLVLSNATTYVDAGSLVFATTYSYRVQHLAGAWSGPFSNPVTVNTLLQTSCVA